MYAILNLLTWLNRISGTLLDVHAVAILVRIREAQQANSMVRIQSLIERLLNLTNRTERAEAQVECGVILYQMGDFNGAYELLDQARFGFADDDHKQAVVSWMIGIVLLEIPSRRQDVIANWVTAIRLFRQIVQSRFHAAKRPDPLWHEQQIPLMEAALEETIENEVI
jgi:hypothetical protein